MPAMVRIEVEKTSFKKIIVCFLFPSEYPSQPILIELKSKTLKDKLLTGLTKVKLLRLNTVHTSRNFSIPFFNRESFTLFNLRWNLMNLSRGLN